MGVRRTHKPHRHGLYPLKKYSRISKGQLLNQDGVSSRHSPFKAAGAPGDTSADGLGSMADGLGHVSRKRPREEDVYAELDSDQRAAFDQALNGRNLFLTGGPGTGKWQIAYTASNHPGAAAQIRVRRNPHCCASRWRTIRVQTAAA
jgi:hypothetical protein